MHRYIEYFILIIIIWNIIIIINKKKKYKKMIKKEIEIFNLGSSHSYFAFDYDGIKSKQCMNLANPSQTFYYDYKILNYFFNKLKNNGRCFLTISYFSFAGRERWLAKDMVQYYKILKLNDFKGKEKIEYLIFNYFPIIWSLKKKYNKKFHETIESYGKERILGHVNKLKENKNLEYNLDILEKMILKCQEKNIEITFITTPFTLNYNSYFKDELLENNFYKIINKIVDKFGVKYIDFSHDYINFTNEDFEDDDHLSKKGSQKFMYMMKEELLK